MTASRLILRSLIYFRAAHGALLAGMILVTTVLTGALILGDSVRDSLTDLAARRRGNYESIITAPALFSTGLAQRSAEFSGRSCAAGLVLPGRVRSERSALSGAAQLVAIPSLARLARREAWITHSVAEALQVDLGDALVITLPHAEGSTDAVLARRDRASLGSLRVTVNGILDEQPVSLVPWFDLHPSQRPPANIWLNLADLQDALMADVPAAQRIPQSPANVLLVGSAAPDQPIQERKFLLPFSLPPQAAMTLEDYGLGLSPAGDEMILHSGTLYLPPSVVAALHRSAGQTQTSPDRASRPLEVYTLLLDRVTTDNTRMPPLNYVMATGLGAELKDDEAAVNQWTAEQLSLIVGDVLHVNPYRVQGDAVLVAEVSTFKVVRILPMTGRGADPTLTPAFHGLTDADTVANWNPPAGFPFDRTRVTPADEAYWNDHKAAPKIFFNLLAAQRLAKLETAVSPTGSSVGELTSVRLPTAQAQDFERDLLKALTPQAAGFVQRPFAPAQPANTDFASLFLGLSGFLLIAALLLVVLLFRLAAEQRARQMGLLAALGFTPRRIARLILAEGILVAVLGALAGLPAAALYTGLLVRGLGTCWIGATGTRAIELHLRGTTLALGGTVSLLAAGLALWFSARRMARATAGAQLRGDLHANQPPRRAESAARPRIFTRTLPWIAIALALLPLPLSGIGILAAPIAFLLAGFLLLTVAIFLLARLPAASRRVRHSLVALATAGILRQRTRAVLCVGLMAAAAFLLTSVTAFESAPATPTKPPSPTGGYQLILTTQIPLPANLQTPAGRKLLGVPEDPLFGEVCFTPLLVQPGDDISCLNMTRPASATLVGVPADVLQRLAVARRSPLVKTDAIPAAVDQQTAAYILHVGLGDHLPQATTPRPIVIDRLLTDSIFQNAALIPDADFRQLFPAIPRSSLILVDCPPASVPALRTLLRQHLDDFGITVETTTQRLASYHAVADSYIAAFQFLGALALLTGTLGLVVVLARNVIQRRAELALLQALGFTQLRVTLLLVIEHGLLLTVGLALGVLTALLATLPQIRQVHAGPVASAVAVILFTGLVALIIAARLAMQRLTPAALRQE